MYYHPGCPMPIAKVSHTRLRKAVGRAILCAYQTRQAMTATFQTNITDRTYNGWSNYETWNVALWLQNDEGLYNLAQEMGSYEDLLPMFYEFGSKETPDGVRWDDPKVNNIELNSEVFDF